MDRLKKKDLKEINFLYESSTVPYDVCSEVSDDTFKFDPPKLLFTTTKFTKTKKIKKYYFFDAAKKKKKIINITMHY